MTHGPLLKRDALGTIERDDAHRPVLIVRETAAARRGLRRLALWLARREASALTRLAAAGVAGVPRPAGCKGSRLMRTWIAGRALHRAVPPDAAYFRDARRLLKRIHRAGVTHNDLAKEANWLKRDDGSCALVDFQLAICFERRGRLFRLLAREDLRHLLKHKRQYIPAALTTRERALLAHPSAAARLWRTVAKPVYRLITRRLLGWRERSGADERGAMPDID